MPYAAEPIPADLVSSMLDTNWNTQGGSIPEPTFFVVNSTANPQIKVDLRRGDYVIIAVDTPAEEETPIGTWVYGNRRTRVLLEVATQASRQRLYDLKQEIRRVIHSQIHSMTNYQRVQYVSFNELTEMQTNIWVGHILIELVNNAVLLET